MPQVLPGNVTGLYYILLSNLAWTCTWQRLKDFARNQDNEGHCLSIEHAQVYPGSTSGWVTVRGREDFLKALQHLQGGILLGRALVADGRNETEPIQIRDLAVPTARDASFTTSISTTFDNDRGVAKVQQTHSLEIPYNTPILPKYNTPILPELSAVMAPVASVFGPPLQFLSPQFMGAPLEHASNSIYGQLSRQFDIMTVVKSKVIITQIPHQASASDLKRLIQGNMNKYLLENPSAEDLLPPLRNMTIESHPDGNQKSHAFLVFETYAMAKAVVDLLDGLQFKGRKLRARLAKEGAESRPSFMPHVLQSKALAHDAKFSKPGPPIAPQEGKMTRPKYKKEEKGRLMEAGEKERIRASAVATVAAVAAAAKKKETSPKSPMVANGSSPGKNF